MYSSQLFYGVQDLPYFFSSSLIVDEHLDLAPPFVSEHLALQIDAVLFPQRSLWAPMAIKHTYRSGILSGND